MVEHNFWFWLLDSFSRQVFGYVIRFPAHEYWGLADSIMGNTLDLLTIMLRYAGSFIGFQQLGIFVGIIITFEIALWIKRLTVDNLFTIIKFFV